MTNQITRTASSVRAIKYLVGIIMAAIAGIGGLVSCGPDEPAAPVNKNPNIVTTHYANCDEVKAAGKAPLHRGDPGYSSSLDRDGDGLACTS